jgi:hypothetical protein
MIATLFGGAGALAQSSHPNWDPAAVDVLKKMNAYTASMKQLEVTAEAYTDHEITGPVVISNPSMSKITVDRSGSLHSVTRNARQTSEIFVHEGVLTVFTDEHNYYTRTDVPEDLDEALEFALEKFDVEMPAFDLLLVESLKQIVTDEEHVIYVTDSSSIRGVDCHQIVISGPHADFQLWVEKGSSPAPRRTLLTFKTQPQRPRHEVFLDWKVLDDLDSSDFEFKPPDGAREIGFVDSP